MQTVGRIAIRGAFGAPVQTDMILLSIKPAVTAVNEVNYCNNTMLYTYKKQSLLLVRIQHCIVAIILTC